MYQTSWSAVVNDKDQEVLIYGAGSIGLLMAAVARHAAPAASKWWNHTRYAVTPPCDPAPTRPPQMRPGSTWRRERASS